MSEAKFKEKKYQVTAFICYITIIVELTKNSELGLLKIPGFIRGPLIHTKTN